MKKFYFIFVFFSFCFNINTQLQRVEITGTLVDLNSDAIANAHIVNLNTNMGTISNSKGIFKLKVKEGDWIKITNLKYQQKKLKITRSNIKSKTKLIYLISNVNLLEEVEIKKRITGFLNFDRIEKSKDTIPKIDSLYYDFSKMDIKPIKKVYTKADALYNTDPTMKNAPVTFAAVSIPNYRLIKKRKLRKKLTFKVSFPDKLKQLLGERYFFEKLKIPKDKYYHFIDYCSYVGVEQLYKDKKYVDLLKILLKESKSYLLLQEKNK
ncbi:MAG: carboxypeptidase-like regulatory domain-containing protein [Flavobacteriaceae bacterium]|nr:carboxypeptidase-like regulatory domain-containing protein [Flavobacteriaceae bacterium]